jgi:hypothetical protein
MVWVPPTCLIACGLGTRDFPAKGARKFGVNHILDLSLATHLE